MNIRHKVAAGSLLVLALVAIWGYQARRRVTLSAPENGSGEAPVVRLLRDPIEVPEFTVTDVDGWTTHSTEWRGKVVLVNFWATWCAPCRAEIADLVALQDKYREHLVIVGISEDEAPVEVVKRFAEEQKINYSIAMVTPELRKAFPGVAALPTTFVLDQDGLLVQKHVGILSPANTEAELLVLAGLSTNTIVEYFEDDGRVYLGNAAQAKEIPGVDLASLTPEQKIEALQALNADSCTCGCGLTVAQCRINDPSCEVSLPLAREMVEKIASGTGAAGSTPQ